MIFFDSSFDFVVRLKRQACAGRGYDGAGRTGFSPLACVSFSWPLMLGLAHIFYWPLMLGLSHVSCSQTAPPGKKTDVLLRARVLSCLLTCLM